MQIVKEFAFDAGGPLCDFVPPCRHHARALDAVVDVFFTDDPFIIEIVVMVQFTAQLIVLLCMHLAE